MKEVNVETLEQVSAIDTNVTEAHVIDSSTLVITDENFEIFSSIKRRIVKMIVPYKDCHGLKLGVCTITSPTKSAVIRIAEMKLKNSRVGSFDLIELILRPPQ